MSSCPATMSLVRVVNRLFSTALGCIALLTACSGEYDSGPTTKNSLADSKNEIGELVSQVESWECPVPDGGEHIRPLYYLKANDKAGIKEARERIELTRDNATTAGETPNPDSGSYKCNSQWIFTILLRIRSARCWAYSRQQMASPYSKALLKNSSMGRKTSTIRPVGAERKESKQCSLTSLSLRLCVRKRVSLAARAQ